MGRIKTTLIKRVTNKLIEEHKSEFSTDFSKNKVVVEKLLDVESKKFRNIIAGYITRIIKKQRAL